MKGRVCTFQEIMDYHPDNINVYKEIRGNISKLVPFVGAGLTAFCYGTWKQVLKELATNMTDADSICEFEHLLENEENYVKAAQFLKEKRTPHNFKVDIARSFSIDKFDGDKQNKLPKEPLYLLPQLFCGLILTTNLDRLLEEVYKMHGKELTRLHPGQTEMLNYFLRENVEYGLFKLHGSVFKQYGINGEEKLEGDTLVFSEDEYAKHYKKNSKLYKTLSTCLKQNALLFLGCSLDQDKTMDVLKSVMQPGMTHYAIMDCARENRDEKIRELGKKQIRAILYDSEHYEAVRIILEHLLEETNPEAYHGLNVHISAYNQNLYANRFSYESHFIKFVGRDSELEQLTNFMEDKHTFLWWAIIGPAGSGKSSLADAFIHEHLPPGFSVRYIQLEEYSKLSGINMSLTDKCLVVVDYVQTYVQQFRDWIQQLAKLSRSLPLRILLIDRASDEMEGRDDFWGKELFRSDIVRRCCYDPDSITSNVWFSHNTPKLLRLTPLDDRDLLSIMDQYYHKLKSVGESLQTKARIIRTDLSEESQNMLLKKLKLIDGKLCRPLYLLFLLDAYLYGRNPEKWDRVDVLDYILAHERERIRKYLLIMKEYSREDEKLLELCLQFRNVATILQSPPLEILEKNICPKEWSIIERKTDSFPSVKKFFQRIGLVEEDLMLALKPDLIGEYAVYNWLIQLDAQTVKDILLTLWDFPSPTGIFFERLVSDYGDVIEPEHWEHIIPLDMNLSEKATLSYARLLVQAIRNCRITQQGYQMLLYMEKLYHEHSSQKELQTLFAKSIVCFSDKHYNCPGSYSICIIDDMTPPSHLEKLLMECLESLYRDHPDNEDVVAIFANRLIARCTYNHKEINLIFKDNDSVLKLLKEIYDYYPHNIEVARLLAMELNYISFLQSSSMVPGKIKKELEILYRSHPDDPQFAFCFIRGLNNLVVLEDDISGITSVALYLKEFYKKYGDDLELVKELARGAVNVSAKQNVREAVESIEFLKEVCKKYNNDSKLTLSLAQGLANICGKYDVSESEKNVKCLSQLCKEKEDSIELVEEYARGLVNLSAKQDITGAAESIKILKEICKKYEKYSESGYLKNLLDFGNGNLNIKRARSNSANESVDAAEKTNFSLSIKYADYMLDNLEDKHIVYEQTQYLSINGDKQGKLQPKSKR